MIYWIEIVDKFGVVIATISTDNQKCAEDIARYYLFWGAHIYSSMKYRNSY